MPIARLLGSRPRLSLAAIVALAFLLRLISGLVRGSGFVDDGYSFYAEIARTFWDGNGLCYAPNDGCAVRVPLYPVLVAPFIAAGVAYPWLIILKALVGALQPLIAYGLGSALFNRRVAFVAAIGAAINPYAVWHGPSFQDTVIFNALIASAVLLLIHARRRDDPATSLTAGLCLALAMLTTARLILFVPVALAWMMAARRGSGLRARVLQTACVALPVVLLVGGWVARNARVVGAPVLTTEFGLSLWLANHPVTLAFLPDRSIDLATPVAWALLTHSERRAVLELSDSAVAEDRYFARLAIDNVAHDPWRVAAGAFRKVVYSFNGWLSPARGWPLQLAYLAIFAPLNALGLVGLWQRRRAGPEHLLVLLLFVTFTVTTAIFWAHTSHRSFLHVFLIVYAASVVVPVITRTRDGSGRCPHPSLDALLTAGDHGFFPSAGAAPTSND